MSRLKVECKSEGEAARLPGEQVVVEFFEDGEPVAEVVFGYNDDGCLEAVASQARQVAWDIPR